MAQPVQLKDQTLQAFKEYIHVAEVAMEETLHGNVPFLWSDASTDRAKEVRRGQIVANFWSGPAPVKVSDGLIHDWIGTAFIPCTTVCKTVALIQDYNNHKDIYKPEVIDSKLVSRRGDDFKIFLRLMKKKIITVVLDTDHDVQYVPLNSAQWLCHSFTTRIAEVEDAGKASEKVLPADTGYGFLWRLCSYWRLQERDGGAYVECRAISLTRDVPTGLGWIVEPIIRKLPRESLVNTLNATRQALLSGATPCSGGACLSSS